MGLADLIRKRVHVGVATATPATVATVATPTPPKCSKVATVAVATATGGKVEQGDLHQLIDDCFVEIDQARPGMWDGWRQSLSAERRRLLVEIETRIDACCLSGDHHGLVAALATLKALCIG